MNLKQLQQSASQVETLINSGMTIDMSKIENVLSNTKLNRRERRRNKFGPTYTFRGLPCNIQPDDKLWCVCGGMKGGGGGVLEWCYDEEDAKDILKEMRKYSYFIGLHACAFFDKFKELKDSSLVKEGEQS